MLEQSKKSLTTAACLEACWQKVLTRRSAPAGWNSDYVALACFPHKGQNTFLAWLVNVSPQHPPCVLNGAPPLMEPLVATGRRVSSLCDLKDARFRSSSATETTLVNSSAGNDDNAEISSCCESMRFNSTGADVGRADGSGPRARPVCGSLDTLLRTLDWRLPMSQNRIRGDAQWTSAESYISKLSFCYRPDASRGGADPEPSQIGT